MFVVVTIRDWRSCILYRYLVGMTLFSKSLRWKKCIQLSCMRLVISAQGISQWCCLTGLYCVHSFCYFTFHTLRYYCDRSVQPTKNHLIKTKRAGVDFIDRIVRKKTSLRNHFQSEIFKQRLIKQFKHTTMCNILLKMSKWIKCSEWWNNTSCYHSFWVKNSNST